MTYYELVKFLDGLINAPIDYKNIEFLNSVSIRLEGVRYERFLNQLEETIEERIRNVINKTRDKLLTETMNIDVLTLEASVVKNEIQYCLGLSKCLLVQPESQEEFVQSIIETNNNLIDTLMTFFDDEARKEVLSSLYLKEVIE